MTAICNQKYIFRALFFLFFISAVVSGCKGDETEAHIETDLAELSELINIPAEVVSSEWQMGDASGGRDSWLAASLFFDLDNLPARLMQPISPEYIAAPPGFQLGSSFQNILELDGAKKMGSSVEFTSLVERFSAEPFVKGGFRSGMMLNISDRQIIVFMYTM